MAPSILLQPLAVFLRYTVKYNGQANNRQTVHETKRQILILNGLQRNSIERDSDFEYFEYFEMDFEIPPVSKSGPPLILKGGADFEWLAKEFYRTGLRF